MVQIKLSRSRLCPDCDIVYEDDGCPFCGTEDGLWIAKVLDRTDMESGCWNWTASHNRLGYPRFEVRRGKSVVAHRLLFRIFRGRIPPDTDLDHLCRNRGCVNPWHLEPVSHAENCRRGAKTKLTAEQVAEIRASRTSNAQLAKQYGVERAHINAIVLRKVWKDV